MGVGTGYQQRYLGAAVDNILSAHIVLYNGTVVDTADAQHSDLLFGIRGAAPNFGVVTQITEKLHNALDVNQGTEVRHASFFIPQAFMSEMFRAMNVITTDPSFPDQLMLTPIIANSEKSGEFGMLLSYAHYCGPGQAGLAISAPWEDKLLAALHNLPEDAGTSSASSADFLSWTHMQMQEMTHIALQQHWYPIGE